MISLIITVKNERDNLPAWLASIRTQNCQPDEVVIVDGGSTDGTWEWLQTIASPTIQVFQHAGNIASGRNFAISKAVGNIIVATDAGCTYAPEWFEKLVSPLQSGQAQFVATGFKPWLEKDDRFLLYLLAASTTPAQGEFIKDWLPSSRSVAFMKELWQSVGGYPEWIPFCEDVIFDLNIIEKGIKPFYIREPLVAWRPRPTLAKYFRQLYNYTRSEGQGRLNTLRQIVRYVVYGGTLVILLTAAFTEFVFVPLVPIGAFFYMYKFWRRFWEFSVGKSVIFRAAGLVSLPFIVAFGDVGKMCGWMVGMMERLRRKIVQKKYGS